MFTQILVVPTINGTASRNDTAARGRWKRVGGRSTGGERAFRWRDLARHRSTAGFRPVLLILTAVLLLDSPVVAQVTVTVDKNGDDINLSWSGGAGPYDVIRATSPRMTASAALLASNAAGTSFTDPAAVIDGVGLYCYIVSDVASKPNLNITMPCDTPSGGPPCNVATTQRTINVSGTTGASLVHVNEVQATVGGGVFSVGAALLNLGQNTITAAAKGASGDWSIDQITVTRGNGNQAPTIEVTVSDRGDTPTGADGATIYDPTPGIIVNYSDPDGTIDPADLRVYINGTDKTSSLTTPTATQATYQVPPGEEWSAGSNFVYATIQDGNLAPTGYSSSASAHIVLSNPTIASFSPAAEGGVGAAITINGAGFDPTPAGNTVTFGAVPTTISAATRATLEVTVPAGAQTSDVVVTVDGRASRGRAFRVVLASGWQSISSLALNPSVSNHVFFTDRGSNDNLYEILDDGTTVARCALAEPTGLPVDSSGNLYFGNATSPGAAGPVSRYEPAGSTCGLYRDTRLLGEATASTVGATLTDVGGSINVYTADEDNDKIKRIDPALNVTGIATAQVFVNPTGMVVNSANDTLYFSSTNAIMRVVIPGGGASTLVRNLVGAPRGLAITDVDTPGGANKLIIARTSSASNAVSWYDPTSSGNPFWDLATGFPNPPGPRAVALGSEGSSRFIVVAEPTKVYRIPKPSVLLTDDADNALPTKFVIDFGTETTDCIGGTTITLKVKFSPGTTLIPNTIPSQLVTWTVEDPDDPSPDVDVDPNDVVGPTANDNVEPLGSYNQWEAVSGFPLMTGCPDPPCGSSMGNSAQVAVVGGVSRVKFHPSCQRGDNYRFRASVTIPIYGAIEASSDVLTVWRKLHVERDSMGVALGPFDAVNPDPTGISDAVIEDVPDPILDFMATAFKPAYVDVVLPPDTGLDTPDVRFKYNVPRTATDIGAQSSLGKGSTSTEGRWVVYVQGAYDHDEQGWDNDPDSESTEFGVAVHPGGHALVFIETPRDSQIEQGVTDLQYLVAYQALHEIAHQFGIDDVPCPCPPSVGCVMEDAPVPSPVFCPDQIRKIRDKSAPGSP